MTPGGGALVAVLGDLGIGIGGTTVWNMTSGTNVTAASGSIMLGTNSGGRALISVSGAGTLWSNSTAGYMSLGANAGASGNEIVVSNQARMVSGNTAIGGNGNIPTTGYNTYSNRVTVTDAGTAWDAGSIIIGTRTTSGNQLLVSNGALVRATSVMIGNTAQCPSNSLVVTGPGSQVILTGALSITADRNTIMILDGAYVTNSSTTVAGDTTCVSNTIVVAGAGSTWVVGGVLNVANQSVGNTMVISNGGVVTSGGNSIVGSVGGRGNSNMVLVTGAGSQWNVGGTLFAGQNAAGNAVYVSNGALVVARIAQAGNAANGTNNLLAVLDGGVLDALTLANGTGPSNRIVNVGGIYQFATNTPVVAPGTNASLGMISISGGTISFRGITNADVRGSLGNNQLTNILFAGNNSFRLNGASNWSANAQNYTFDSGISPSNYVGLEMINGGTAWRSAWLNIGAGGSMLVSNSASTVAGVLTNAGTLRVVNSTVTWLSNVVVGGGYVSDPSTNVFAGSLSVAPSGYLAGSNGDLFVFQKDFVNQSTNAGQFSLSQAAVLFTNSATHLLSVSNSGSLNIGQGFESFAQVASNFAIGQLSIAAGDRLTLAGNRDSLTNALYVGWLDLQGAVTNSFDAATNSIFLALELPSINLYYDKFDARNAWLNQWIPSTGYDLWGGGLLLPIPEPSAFAVTALGLFVFALLRRRRA